MSRELAADPIQTHDDDSDESKFVSARTTRRSTATPASSESRNKRLLATKSTAKKSNTPPLSTSTKTPPRSNSSSSRRSSGSARKAPLTAALEPRPVRAAPTDDNDDGDQWTVRVDNAAPSNNGAKKAPLRPVKASSLFDDDNSDSDSGVIVNSTSHRPAPAGAKRSAAALFNDAPILPYAKRAAASAAESAMHAKPNGADGDDDDDSGPLQVTAVLPDDDDDDFMSACDLPEGSGSARKASKKKASAAAAAATAKSPPKKSPSQAKIDRELKRKAAELAKLNPSLKEAHIFGKEDDWLGGSLESIMAAAPEIVVESASQSSRSKRKAPANKAATTAAVAAASTSSTTTNTTTTTTKWSVSAPRSSAADSAFKFIDSVDSPPSEVVASPVVARRVVSPDPPQREPEAMPPLLPEFRDNRDGVAASVLLKNNTIMLAMDKIMSGATKCARMIAFNKGGKARSALAHQVATGYFSPANVDAMHDALLQRYKTDSNIEYLGGELNVMRVIGDVLLPELAVELMRRACGNKISVAQAIYFVEHPPISSAAQAKALAEARGASSRVARLQR